MDRKRTRLHEVEDSSLPAIPHFRYFQNAAGNPANGHQDPSPLAARHNHPLPRESKKLIKMAWAKKGAKCCTPVAQMLHPMLHLKCLIINSVAPVAPSWP